MFQKKKFKKFPHMLPTCRIYFKDHSSAEKNQLSNVKKPRADILQTFKNQFRIISLAVSHLAYIYYLVDLLITHNKWNVSFSLFKKSHIHSWFKPPRSRGISVTFTQRATIQKMFFMRPKANTQLTITSHLQLHEQTQKRKLQRSRVQIYEFLCINSL